MQNISYLLIKASRQLRNKLDKALKEFDLTAAQFSVINQINNSKNPITAAEIAETLGSDRPTISGIINRLETKGIVIKTNNPGDKRSSYLEIDKSYSLLIEEITRITDELNSNIFSFYTQDEANQLESMMRTLLARTQE